MAIPGFFPQEVSPCNVQCPTAGAGMGATVSRFSCSVWYCRPSYPSFQAGNSASNGFQIQPGVGGSGPAPPPPTSPNVGQLTVNIGGGGSHLINNSSWTGNIPCYDQFDTGGTEWSAGLLTHFLFAFDLAAQLVQIWCNDTQLTLASGAGFLAAGSITNSALTWALQSAGLGCDGVGDFWVSPTYIDWSVLANRRQFINADLSGVALPSDGSVTIGGSTVHPVIFLHTTAAGSPSDFTTNNGTGPAWSSTSGVLTFPSAVYPNPCLGSIAPTPTVTAPDYSFTTPQDTELDGTLYPTSTGTTEPIHTFIQAWPSNGSLFIDGLGHTFAYTPDDGYSGPDSFQYQAAVYDPVTSAVVAYDIGTVSIDVGGAPPYTGIVKVLLPPAELQFCDAQGIPYAAGTLEFYEAGTSTPKDTWSDAGGTALNTNPLVLDSAGRAIIFGDGAYRTVLRDSAGNLIWDQQSFTYISACMVPVVGAPDLATARQAMGITDAIAAEAAARLAADNAEQTRAEAAEAALQVAINNEISRAEAAEQHLQAEIDALPSPTPPSTVQSGAAALDSGGHAHVTFPTPFAHSCTAVNVTPLEAGAYPVHLSVNINGATSFDCYACYAGTRTVWTGDFCWMAVGG